MADPFCGPGQQDSCPIEPPGGMQPGTSDNAAGLVGRNYGGPSMVSTSTGSGPTLGSSSVLNRPGPTPSKRFMVSGARQAYGNQGASGVAGDGTGGVDIMGAVGSVFSALGRGIGMVTDLLFRGFSAFGNLFSPSWWSSLGSSSGTSRPAFSAISLDYTPPARDESPCDAKSNDSPRSQSRGSRPSRGGGDGSSNRGGAAQSSRKRS